MRVSKEFKVGIIVVLSSLLVFISINFFKEINPFSVEREFTAEFEKSEGLQVDDEVQLHGVQVGQVTEVYLKEGDASHVIVRFSVDRGELEIPKSSQIWLISSDILGTKVLDLRIPEDSGLVHTAFYEDGDHFPAEDVRVGMPMADQFEAQFGPIQEKTKELVSRVEDIILKVNSFWDSSAAYTIDASMYDVRDSKEKYQELVDNMTTMVQKESAQAASIGNYVTDIKTLAKSHAGTFTQFSNDMAAIMKSFKGISLTSTLTETGNAFADLDTMLISLKEGEGTVGKLAFTDELKIQLDCTKTSITRLKDDLEADPMDFVSFSIFGLKAEGYKPDKGQKKLLDGMLDTLDGGKSVKYKK